MPVPDEVVQLVRSSGNNFHAKVARWFQANGWRVVVSPYYMDQTQGKAREIDLVAEKVWNITGDFRRREGEVAVRLFIECKFIPNYSVFWFTEKDLAASQRLVCSTGLFRPDNTYTQKHHYLETSPRVGKLFATSVGRSQETDPFFKALNQVLNATVSMRGQPITTALAQHEQPGVILEFPVVVCSSFDQVFQVDFYADSSPTPVTKNFQFEVQYAYLDKRGAQRDDYFLLDFVEFQQLDRYAAAIDQDTRTAGFFRY